MNIYSENVVAQSIDRETDMKVVLRVQKRTIFLEFFVKLEVELAIGQDGRGDQDPDVEADAEPRRDDLDPHGRVPGNGQCSV